MNKNIVSDWVALLVVIVGSILIGLAAFKYNEITGWGFGTVGIGFFVIVWVFNALRGRV